MGSDNNPYGYRCVIRPICITILYHNLLLFIDIFHIMDMILMLFPLFCMYDGYEGNNCRSQILMEKATSRHHIYEDQKLREKLFYGVLQQKTEVAKRRRSSGPQGAHTWPRRGALPGPRLGRVWPPWPTSGKATSRTSSLRLKNPKYRLTEEFRRRCGTENTREKKTLRQAEICRGNFSRRGGNH